MNGLLIVDKPAGWTSHDVVAKLRRLAGERSIGHLGTLDPMATGVLPLLLGRWTRLATFFAAATKEYEGTIRFGFETDTYDAEGKPTTGPRDCSHTQEDLDAAVKELTGHIRQTPPPFSAKKIGGVPAYKLARREQPVELAAVDVLVESFDVRLARSSKISNMEEKSEKSHVFRMSDNAYYVKSHAAIASFRTTVSSGTYIRSLAVDLGRKLGCGAHLASLRRTRSGHFDIKDAHTMPELEELAAQGELASALLPLPSVLPELPAVAATQEQMARVRHGNSLNLAEFSRAPLVRVLEGDELAAIAQRVAGTLFQPKVVLV